MLNILQRKMFSIKCIWCKNAFDAKMHLMPKCIFAYIFQRKMFSWCKNAFDAKIIWCQNAFDAKMHFCKRKQRTFSFLKCSASHFPLENVQLCKNAFDAKMHLMPKCIWCKNAFLQRNAYILLCKMFSITFSKGKCSANQNVRKRQNAFDAYILFCKNAFDAKMHLMQKCIFQRVHFPMENVQRTFYEVKCSASTKCYKCIWCKNAVFFALQKTKMLPLHFVYKMLESGKMHLMQKCIWSKMHFTRTFSKGKCSAYIFQRKMFSCAKMHLMRKMHLMQKWFDAKMHFCVHFPKENVQHHILRCKMFSITFSKGKCSAVQKCIWCKNAFDVHCKNAFDAKMHLMRTFCNTKCYKCIWCQNAFWQFRNATLCKNAFDAKMHLMRTFCYTKCYKCIWCQNAFWLCKNAFLHHIFQRKMFSNAYIFQSKMFSITFYFVKCSASHFPKENVQLCKNAFDAKMHLMQKCIWCQNAFDAKMHLMPKCILATQRNAVQKCIFASHFPKENVQHHIFLWKMWCKAKC